MTDEAHPTFTGVDLGMGSGDYWAAQCFDCHWTGSSKDCDGGLPNCDAGDYSSLECPQCGSQEIEEAPLKHQFETHCDCEVTNCLICDGGLAICILCRGGEGALTTDCVGIPLTSNQIDAIHKGQLDFRNGHWVFEREFFSQLEQI